MASEDEPLEKVLFELGDDVDWHNSSTESVWARRVEKNMYEILNIPFYIYGVSYHDIVETNESNGQNLFKRVVNHSGHSTFRMLIKENIFLERGQNILDDINKMGGEVEGMPMKTLRLLTISIPPDADITSAYAYLQKGEDEGSWDFEEAKLLGKST